MKGLKFEIVCLLGCMLVIFFEFLVMCLGSIDMILLYGYFDK